MSPPPARPGVPPPEDVLLEVRGLKTQFKVMDGTVPAVDGVDFSLRRGETLGLVGESGSGKSVTSLSIMRLIERPGEIVAGEIWFEGRDLLQLPEADMEDIRGNDITMIYTGGTTGMPKGVVSKVGPSLANLLETVPPLVGRARLEIDDIPSFTAGLEEVIISLPAPPLMHNTGLGSGVAPALATGGTVVLLEGRRFDAATLWDTVAAERVNSITVVGDPFARPMLTALNEDASRDLACVRFISSSGAMFSAEVKSGLLGHLPQAVIIDLIAASEGTMGMSISTADAPAPTGQFRPSRGVMVLTEDGHPVEPGSGQAGLVALPGGAEGYYKDEAKTAATFRVLDGQRYTIPGDYATVEADGTLVLLGRGSSCINTAGEKVYPEEVEEILKALPWVEDALVFGVDDERFGQKVAAVLSRAPDTDEPLEGILAVARQKLASYKLPRFAIIVDVVPRTQVGKADYAAARQLLEGETRSK